MNDALPSGTHLQNGAFVLGEVIGRGGSGFTYVARDTALHRTVAIKEFFPIGSARIGAQVQSPQPIEYSIERAAFVQEARSLARFAHPHIVHVFAVWEENETAYLVTEFLDGQTLQEIVETRAVLSQSEALQMMAPVCRAVEAVHRGGLLHGDIKPQNIIRCYDGRVVLLDFGLTRPAPTTSYATTLLVPQNAAGTAGYAPLEQYSRSARTGTWSDVYALCATLWHLLGGSPPPDAPDRASGTPLPALRPLNPTVSAHIEHVLHSGLAMDALARPQSARELWTLLDENTLSLAGQSHEAVPMIAAPSSTRIAPPMPVSTRPSINDENAVGMLIVMSIVLF
ncbi:MAG TPA: serine/threonine-protein kinase, partial [Abditibacteriaceae bacterium]|nr:serine/threonine-protein kinase [Abditibacteriaceae bacterium]